MEEDGAKRAGAGGQLIGSLAAAALIVALAVWAVTAKLGPTSIAEREAAEEQAEDSEEAREEAAEDTREAREGSGRNRRRGGRN